MEEEDEQQEEGVQAPRSQFEEEGAQATWQVSRQQGVAASATQSTTSVLQLVEAAMAVEQAESKASEAHSPSEDVHPADVWLDCIMVAQ